MDAGVHCSKEMVDLLMRLKKHLKAHHGISLNMSDTSLLSGLLQLATIEDDVLQGMIQYLMALAGEDWNRRYLAAANKAGSRSQFSKARSQGRLLADKLKERVLADTAADTTSTLSSAVIAVAPEQGTKVRYYRGQPVYG